MKRTLTLTLFLCLTLSQEFVAEIKPIKDSKKDYYSYQKSSKKQTHFYRSQKNTQLLFHFTAIKPKTPELWMRQVLEFWLLKLKVFGQIFLLGLNFIFRDGPLMDRWVFRKSGFWGIWRLLRGIMGLRKLRWILRWIILILIRIWKRFFNFSFFYIILCFLFFFFFFNQLFWNN